jgi:hypothetical protein
MSREEHFNIGGVSGSYMVKADRSEATAWIGDRSWVLKKRGDTGLGPKELRLEAALLRLSRRIWPLPATSSPASRPASYTRRLRYDDGWFAAAFSGARTTGRMGMKKATEYESGVISKRGELDALLPEALVHACHEILEAVAVLTINVQQLAAETAGTDREATVDDALESIARIGKVAQSVQKAARAEHGHGRAAPAAGPRRAR